MDLANLDTSKKSAEGAEMYLLHPVDFTKLTHEKDGEETEMFIKLLGRDSKEFKAAAHSVNKAASSGADIEALSAAAITLDGLVYLKKEWVTITTDNAAEIYEKYTWILEQVSSFALDRTNFFPDANVS